MSTNPRTRTSKSVILFGLQYDGTEEPLNVTANGTLVVSATGGQSVVIIDNFGSPQPISVITTLLPSTDLGDNYSALMFCVVNLDSTNIAQMTLDTSEDGTHWDSNIQQIVQINPGQQGTIELDNVLRTYWRLSAQSLGPSYPVIDVMWKIKGVPR